MKFARLGLRGHEVPVVVEDDTYFSLQPLTTDIDGAFLADDGIERARAAMASGALEPVPATDTTRIGSPVARPGSLICIGMNYAAHAAESGAAPPEVPIMFLKTTNTVVGPYDDVEIPRGSQRTDWEVELGIVIGKPTLYLDSPDQALQHIAGFVTANDLSERTFQLDDSGGQWSKGKCCPGFSPLGPWLVTPDEIDHQSLTLASWVNGQARQASTTADQIFDVATIVHHLSQYLALEPGDVILTGTPEGVALSGRFPYLAIGDEVEVEITGLGRQRQRFIAHTESGR